MQAPSSASVRRSGGSASAWRIWQLFTSKPPAPYLPVELRSLIVSYIISLEDLKSLRLVSKHWADVCSPILFQRLCFLPCSYAMVPSPATGGANPDEDCYTARASFRRTGLISRSNKTHRSAQLRLMVKYAKEVQNMLHHVKELEFAPLIFEYDQWIQQEESPGFVYSISTNLFRWVESPAQKTHFAREDAEITECKEVLGPHYDRDRVLDIWRERFRDQQYQAVQGETNRALDAIIAGMKSLEKVKISSWAVTTYYGQEPHKRPTDAVGIDSGFIFNRRFERHSWRCIQILMPILAASPSFSSLKHLEIDLLPGAIMTESSEGSFSSAIYNSLKTVFKNLTKLQIGINVKKVVMNREEHLKSALYELLGCCSQNLTFLGVEFSPGATKPCLTRVFGGGGDIPPLRFPNLTEHTIGGLAGDRHFFIDHFREYLTPGVVKLNMRSCYMTDIREVSRETWKVIFKESVSNSSVKIVDIWNCISGMHGMHDWSPENSMPEGWRLGEARNIIVRD